MDPDKSSSSLAREFRELFGRTPQIYRAPGRANLIGEHTDYNDGFALPMALDRSTWVAAAPRADRTLVARSREYRETFTIDLDRQPAYPTESWIDYVRGVAAVLNAGGADVLIASDVPIGAGLGSSAALEIAVGYALLDLHGRAINLSALAQAGQRAEHEFVGTRCGIMDQLVACYGREGRALLLDTRSLTHDYVPLPAAVRVIVANTMVKHELANGEYNARRRDCEAGVAQMAVPALRDVTVADVNDARGELSDAVFRHCRHVVTENDRTIEAAQALIVSDFERAGRLMNASHESLRDDYNVSCPELDAMASIAQRLDGVYGARMMGGGFGGSAVALVDATRAEAVRRALAWEYRSAIGIEPDVWICSAGNGVTKASE